MSKITIIRIDVDGKVSVKELDNSLKSLQKEVGGYIEVVSIGKVLRLVIDEEGKLKNKDVNEQATWLYQRRWNTTDYIVGTALVVYVNGDEFESIPESTLSVILKLFSALKL